jgi:haloalkane dehalogenase
VLHDSGSTLAFIGPRDIRSGWRPTLVWPGELPIEGEPADVVRIVEDYGRWLAGSPVPKLFIDTEPGALIGARGFCRMWPNQREASVRDLNGNSAIARC